MVDKKECLGSFILKATKYFVAVAHLHDPMQPIEWEILKRKIVIQNEINNNLSVSISKIWEKIILDLTAIMVNKRWQSIVHSSIQLIVVSLIKKQASPKITRM